MPRRKGLKPPKSITWKDAIGIIEALGGTFIRQAKGHRRYELLDKAGRTHSVDIPKDNDIDDNLLSSIIQQTGVGKKKFWEAFYKK